jgi:WD40 repeat protein
LAAAAVANLQTDPERSILLAMEAIDRTRSVDGSVLPEASEALHQAVTTSRVVMGVPGIGGAVAWSVKGVFVTEGPQGTGMVDIRDADSGASVLPPFRGHDGDITDVAFSIDGSMLATTGDDGALNVWNPATGDLLRSVSHAGDVRAPSFSRDGELVAGAWGSTIRIMDLADGNVIQTIRLTDLAGVTDTVDAALSGDGEAIALEVGGGVVIVEVATGDISVRLRGSRLVGALAWSPDDRSIATVGFSGVVEIYDATTGDLRNELWGQRSFVWSVAWNPDGSQIVTGGAEGAAQVWNVSKTEGRELFSLKSLEMAGGIGGVAFSPDGDRVMAGAADRSAVKVWDVGPTGDQEWANIPARSFLGDVAFMPDGDRVVVPTARDAAAIWRIDPPRKVRTLGIPGHIRFPGSGNPRVSVSPEGGSILIEGGYREGGPGMLAAYETRTGEVLFRTRGQGQSSDAWSPDGNLVALVKGGSVRIQDRSGREVAILREERDDHRVVAATFSPDGSRLATSVGAPRASEDGGFLRIWDWAGGRVVREVELRPGRELVFDRRGDGLVLFDGQFVETWDFRSGDRNTVRVDDTASIGGFAISPDGTRIAVSSQTGPIRLLDAITGDVLTVLHGHAGQVSALAFSADGTKLASTTTSIVAIGGGTRIWALDIDDLLAIARENVTRELTDEECRQFLQLDRCPAT